MEYRSVLVLMKIPAQNLNSPSAYLRIPNTAPYVDIVFQLDPHSQTLL